MSVDFARRRFLLAQPSRTATAAAERVLSDPGAPADDTGADRVARIDAACFAARGIVCRSCGDVCEIRAIGFVPRIAGPAQPQVDAERCDGCGDCLAVCPAGALSIASPFEQASP